MNIGYEMLQWFVFTDSIGEDTNSVTCLLTKQSVELELELEPEPELREQTVGHLTRWRLPGIFHDG